MGLLSSIKQRRAAKAKGPKAEMHPITVRAAFERNKGNSRNEMCILWERGKRNQRAYHFVLSIGPVSRMLSNT